MDEVCTLTLIRGYNNNGKPVEVKFAVFVQQATGLWYKMQKEIAVQFK